VSTDIIAAVLVAALMHAGWNTIAKLNAARAGDAVIVGIMGAWPAVLTLPWAGLPDRACWPQLAASVAIHFVYFRALARAYAGGDLSVAYPLMRGVPPMMVAAIAVVLFGEHLALLAWGAIGVLLGGVLLLGWDGIRKGALRGSSGRFVALQIVIIACYTLVDASGVRASGTPLTYITWMFVLTATAMAFAARDSLRALLKEGPGAFAVAATGGLFTFGSYAVVLWAMTRAPVALVAALRETSILFGAGLGAWLLRERFGARRWLAVAMIVAGVAGMRLA
jgi:drug/metabolite transporter (DMT)-like permease